jgi:hypothetical protein
MRRAWPDRDFHGVRQVEMDFEREAAVSGSPLFRKK